MTTISTILASGTTDDESSDITVDAGSIVTLSLLGSGKLILQTKTSAGYTSQCVISPFRPGYQLLGPVTFRVVRRDALAACGCSMEAE